MVNLRLREYHYQQSSLYPRAGELPECDPHGSNDQQLWHSYGKGLPICDSHLQVTGSGLQTEPCASMRAMGDGSTGTSAMVLANKSPRYWLENAGIVAIARVMK